MGIQVGVLVFVLCVMFLPYEMGRIIAFLIQLFALVLAVTLFFGFIALLFVLG